MTNLEKYKEVFAEALELEFDKINESLEYSKTPEWDSVGHMNLITMLEEKFGIMFDQDDMLEFSSYENGKEILKKYNILIG